MATDGAPEKPLVEQPEFCVSRLFRLWQVLGAVVEAIVTIVVPFRYPASLLLLLPAFLLYTWETFFKTAWCIEVEGHRVRWETPVTDGDAGLAQVTELKRFFGNDRFFRLVVSGGRSPWIAAYPRDDFEDWVTTLEYRVGRELRNY